MKPSPKEFDTRFQWVTIKKIKESLDRIVFDRIPNWSNIQKSDYVESVVLRINTDVFIFDYRDPQKIKIIDGNERIHALLDFVNGKLELTGLKTRLDLTNQNSLMMRVVYTDLSSFRIENNTTDRALQIYLEKIGKK